MSLGNCIPGLVAGGELNDKQAKQYAETYERHYRRLSRQMGPDAAASEASGAALREIKALAARKRRNALLQVSRQQEALGDIVRHDSGNPYAGIKALLSPDVGGKGPNIETATAAIEFDAHSRLRDFILRHKRNFKGGHNDPAGLDDIVRERHGQDTGNARAKAAADAIGETFDMLRQRFNAAGGNIGKIEHYFPHAHDTLKVRRAGFDAWREDIQQGLDLERTLDPVTQAPFDANGLDEALHAAFEKISTNGLAGDDNLSGGFGGALANQRGDHRFFVFKDGDAWLAYNAKYGREPFGAVMGHVRGLSNDTAMMERMGPNPNATFKWLLAQADRAAVKSGNERLARRALEGSSGTRASAEKLWDFMHGKYSVPALHEGPLLGPLSEATVKGLAGTRALLSAAQLLSAPLSLVSDVNTQIMTRLFNKLPVTDAITGYLKQLNPLSDVDRKLAVRLGLGARDASRELMGLHRYLNESLKPGWTSVVADDGMRLSALSKITEAGQRSFGLAYLGQLADERALSFAELPRARQLAFERAGIDVKEWEAIRRADPLDNGGADYVDYRAVRAQDPRAADRLMNLVLSETASAVQESGAAERSMLTFGRPGTFKGEFGRTALQYKSFSFGLLMNQSRRIAYLSRHYGPGRAALYGASFFAGMTMFGALSIQLREIAKGRDPRPMEGDAAPDFWFDASVQGGGAGVFGDLVGSFNNDRVGSVAQLFGGPMVGLASDIKQAAGTALPHTSPTTGVTREGNPGAAWLRLQQRYTPGGNLWYLRAAYERMVIDELQERIDPNYRKSWDRMGDRARAQGQEFWWQPGDALPARAPHVETAFGSKEPQP